MWPHMYKYKETYVSLYVYICGLICIHIRRHKSLYMYTYKETYISLYAQKHPQRAAEHILITYKLPHKNKLLKRLAHLENTIETIVKQKTKRKNEMKKEKKKKRKKPRTAGCTCSGAWRTCSGLSNCLAPSARLCVFTASASLGCECVIRVLW